MKKWILLVLVFCFGFGEVKSQNDEEYGLSICPVNLPIYVGLNTSVVYSDLISNQINNTVKQFNHGFGLHIEDCYGNSLNPHSIFKYSLNITNLSYEFQKDDLNQNYDLSYLSTNVSYKRLLLESNFYVIGGINLNYLFDVESEIETINTNNEKILINRDLSGNDISNNYNRFDLVGSIGFGYDINMEVYYIFIEPKYNFSFFNHLNENNQELKGMNFKNEFWSLNVGVTFPL